LRELILARAASTGLAIALDTDDEKVQADLDFARYCSLAAEAGAGSISSNEQGGGSGGDNRSAGGRNGATVWKLDTHSQALAQAAHKRCDDWFGAISVNAQSITLIGSRGKLPATINNSGTKPLNLEMRFVPTSEHIHLDPKYQQLNVPTNEMLVEPDVELRNIVSGAVKIQVLAGTYMISEKTVRVSAAYTDKIGILAVVTVAGAALVLYLWRRGRRIDVKNQETET
jgi:hypothetical protein